MNKAFTKDDGDDSPVIVAPRAPLPAGTPNYVTPSGLRALRAEHAGLVTERARLESVAEGDDRTRALAAVGERLIALDERLGVAQLVVHGDGNVVRFGATVVVRGEDGRERCYRIVGVDEADPARGLVAFVAPLARALLGHSEGDEARVTTPRGTERVEVRSVRYDAT